MRNDQTEEWRTYTAKANQEKIKLNEEFCFRFRGKHELELLELGEAKRCFWAI